MQHRHGLRQVEDVDAVADAEDVRRHLRVPAPRVVAEMHASFEQLAHRVGRESHDRSCSGCSAAGSGPDAKVGHRTEARLTPAARV